MLPAHYASSASLVPNLQSYSVNSKHIKADPHRTQQFPTPTYFYSPYYSYVPNNLFNVSTPFGDAFKVENFQTTLRLKLDPGVNGTEVANQIRTLEGNELYGVTSFDEAWRQSQAGKRPLHLRQPTNPRYSRLRTCVCGALRFSRNRPNRHC